MPARTSPQKDWELLQIVGFWLLITFPAAVLIVDLTKDAAWSPMKAIFVIAAVIFVPLHVYLLFARVRALRRGGPAVFDCTSATATNIYLFAVGAFAIGSVQQALSMPPPTEGTTLAVYMRDGALVPLPDDGSGWMLAWLMLAMLAALFTGFSESQIRERGLIAGVQFTPWGSVDAKARDAFVENLSGKTDVERELIRKVIDEHRGPQAADAAVEG